MLNTAECSVNMNPPCQTRSRDDPFTSRNGTSSGGQQWSGSEPFLVGIAPNFWAHVPMSIATIMNMKLINGIHCWSTGGNHVPVSKCVLFGCIVYADIRSPDESSHYVLDDGTGLIDCVVWTNNSVNDIYNLPSLIPDETKNESRNVGIGDTVRVFGKIKCVANRCENEPFVVREIHSSLVELIGNASNEEARHWKACAQHEQDMIRDPTKFNALGYLKQLGPEITAQVMAQRHLPSNDDRLGEWRIFGISCRCDLDYKAELLYCHCVAKVEPLDPDFVFRDLLLAHLLQVQAKHMKKLVFPYKRIKINSKLRDVASTVVLSHDKAKQAPNVNVLIDRLLLNTFRALRYDGIFHLVDENADKYLLISRKWVLEPYVRHQLKQNKRNTEVSKYFIDLEGAPYLSPIHRDRLLYVRRCVAEEQSKLHAAN